MRSPRESSLTGSDCGPPPTHSAAISVALGRVGSGVRHCCWVIAAALLALTVIWGLASFTDLRYRELTSAGEQPLVVQAEASRAQRIRSPLDAARADAESPGAVNPNRVLSTADRVFALVASLARGFGTVAALVLIPLIGLGVILAASSATAGAEKAVSAFGWALATALLLLPAAGLIGLPWQGGALWSYDALCAHLDAAPLPDASVLGDQVVFFARFLVLPLVCVASTILVAGLFGAGIEAGVVRRESFMLDRALEAEAGNVKPSSLHGGRAAIAIRAAIGAHAGDAGPSAAPTVKQLSVGETPRRLI